MAGDDTLEIPPHRCLDIALHGSVPNASVSNAMAKVESDSLLLVFSGRPGELLLQPARGIQYAVEQRDPSTRSRLGVLS